ALGPMASGQEYLLVVKLPPGLGCRLLHGAASRAQCQHRRMRRKGEDTFAMRRRRMPYVAKIKRDDPFRSADRSEIEAMVKRIVAAGETFSIAGWREDAGFLLFHLPTWRRRAPCSTGSTAAASRTARCRCPSMGRNRRVQRVQP